MNDLTNRRLLIIDDNRAIHEDFRKILCGGAVGAAGMAEAESALFGVSLDGLPKNGYEVDSAYQGAEGLEFVRRALAVGQSYALAFVDVRMPPGWDGIETTRNLWQVDPDLQIVLCTAYSDYSWSEVIAKVGQSDRLMVLKKPFDNIEVSQLALALTHKWRLTRQARRKMDELDEMVRERTAELTAANELLRTEITERKQAEQALNESREHYRNLIESQGEGVVITNLDRRFTFANPAAETILGVWPGQLVGKKMDDFVDPNDWPFIHKQFQLHQTGQKSSYEIEITAQTGDRRQILIAGAPQRNSAGQFCGSFKVFRDITQRKQAERALRESQRLQRAILDNIPDPAWLKDAQGRYLVGNKPLASIYNRRLEDIVGKTSIEVFPEGENELARGGDEAARSGKPVRSEYAILDAAGRPRYYDTIETPIFDEQRQVVGMVGIAREVTERRLTEAALQESEARYHSLFDNMLEGFAFCRIIYDQGRPQDFVYLNVNLAFEKLTGLKDVVGKKASEVIPGIQENNPELLETYGRVAVTGKPEKFEARVEALGACFSITAYSYQKEHFVSIFDNITERKRAEELLRVQTSALQAAANGIVITDRAGRMLWVNPAFTQLTGYRADEAIGQTTALMKSGVQGREFYEAMWQTILSGKVWQGELVNRHKDGRQYCEEMIITPLLDAAGQPQKFVAIKQDISARKEFERALAHERDLLQSLMDNVPVWIYFKDLQYRYTRVNRALARVLGLRDPAAAVGKTTMDFISSLTWRQAQVDELRILTTGEPILDALEQMRSPEGKALWVSSTKVALRDSQGNINGLVGISHDVTEHKLIEDQLARERDLLRTLLDYSTDLIYFKDLQSRFVQCSRIMVERFGFTRMEDVAGKSDFDFYGEVHARPAFDDEQEIIRSGKPMIGKLEKETHIDGHVTWCLTTKMPWRDQGGKVIGTFGTSKDVTAMQEVERDRHLMEMQLRQAQKLESIGQLAAGIAHEINTPTQYVGDNTRFLKDAFLNLTRLLRSHGELLAAAKRNAVTPELVAQVEAAVTASDIEYLFEQIPQSISETLEGVERVTKIVRAMKEFSHPGGKEKSAADLNKAIESTTTVAHNEWKYVADLKLELDAGLPLVPCFIGEFNQAILNLVVNAAHAIGDAAKSNPGAKGLITIRTSRQGDQVEVRVSDTGTGIAEEHRSHIFEPFFTTKDVGRGTGQGLSIVYASIVKQHGGTVGFETETGKGATFIIRLPVNPRNPVVDPPADGEPAQHLASA